MLSEKDKSELAQTFRYKLERLNQLQSSSDVNELTEAAGLIRDLLISDSNGLVGDVYRLIPSMRNGRRRRLSFYAVQFASSEHTKEGMTHWFAGDGIVPDTNVPYTQSAKYYTRDDFLRMPVISVNGQVITNKNVILFVANKLGARHWDRNRGDTNTNPVLFELHEQFSVGGMSPAVRTMNGIINIVISSLNSVDERLTQNGY